MTLCCFSDIKKLKKHPFGGGACKIQMNKNVLLEVLCFVLCQIFFRCFVQLMIKKHLIPYIEAADGKRQ